MDLTKPKEIFISSRHEFISGLVEEPLLEIYPCPLRKTKQVKQVVEEIDPLKKK